MRGLGVRVLPWELGRHRAAHELTLAPLPIQKRVTESHDYVMLAAASQRFAVMSSHDCSAI